MRIVAVPAGTGGVAFYRIVQPMQILQEQGKEVFIYDPIKHDFQRLNDEMAMADIIIYQGAIAFRVLEAIRLIKENNQKTGKNQKVVVEYDDDFFNVNHWNEKYHVFGTNEHRIEYRDSITAKKIIESHKNEKWRDIKKLKNGGVSLYLWKDGYNGLNIKENTEKMNALMGILNEAHLVTVTTPQLGKEFRKYRPKGPIAVLPNFLDFRRWLPMDKNNTDKIRIGWQGGSAHFPDFQCICKDLNDVAMKHKNIQYVFKGVQYNLFDDLLDRVTWLPWHGCINTHSLVVRHMAIDIGLCPLEDNKFNHGKSPLKWLEYSAMGIPSICSDIVYENYVEHEKTGLIARKGEWFSAIERLINDVDLRNELAKNALEKVRRDFSENSAMKWYKAFEDLLRPDLITVNS